MSLNKTSWKKVLIIFMCLWLMSSQNSERSFKMLIRPYCLCSNCSVVAHLPQRQSPSFYSGSQGPTWSGLLLVLWSHPVILPFPLIQPCGLLSVPQTYWACFCSESLLYLLPMPGTLSLRVLPSILTPMPPSMSTLLKFMHMCIYTLSSFPILFFLQSTYIP